jgi:hypothetical protein
MIININDTVEVKLTSYGLMIINYHYINAGVKPTGLNENVLETSLWDIMAIFGKYLFMGATNMVFENNEIKIIRSVR